MHKKKNEMKRGKKYHSVVMETELTENMNLGPQACTFDPPSSYGPTDPGAALTLLAFWPALCDERQQQIGHFGNGGLLCSWGPVRQAGRKLQVMYFSSRAIPVTQEQGNDLWPRSTHEIQMVLPPPSVSVLNSVVTSLSSLGSFQLECFLGPAHTSRPLLTTIPASVAGPWAHIPKPLHLEFQLPSSEQACGKNCANSTRLNSSVCSMALACRVFSECLQTPEIYCNYLTCENKPAYEKSSFSFRGSLRVRALLSKGEFVLRFWL